MKKVTMWDYSNNTEGQHFPLNLQLFAEGGEGSEGGGEGGEPPKTYTIEEVNELLQKEGDKRVTEALKKQAKQHALDLENAKNEAERLAKLSADERAREELETQKKQLADEQAKFHTMQLELEVTKQLTKEGLDPRFAGILMGEDAETSATNIKTFKEVWSKAVKDEVDQRLAGNPPESGKGGSNFEDNPFDEKTFNLTKQIELSKTDPEKYAALQAAANK